MTREIRIGDKIIIPSLEKLEKIHITGRHAKGMTGRTVIVKKIVSGIGRLYFDFNGIENWYIDSKDAKLANTKVTSWKKELQ